MKSTKKVINKIFDIFIAIAFFLSLFSIIPNIQAHRKINSIVDIGMFVIFFDHFWGSKSQFTDSLEYFNYEKTGGNKNKAILIDILNFISLIMIIVFLIWLIRS